MNTTQLKLELARKARSLKATFTNWYANEYCETEASFTLNGYDIEVDLEANTFVNLTTGERKTICAAEGYANDICYLANC